MSIFSHTRKQSFSGKSIDTKETTDLLGKGMLSQEDAFEVLSTQRDILYPFELLEIQQEYSLLGRSIDFFIQANLEGKRYYFFAEYKSSTGHGQIERAVESAKALNLKNVPEDLFSEKPIHLIIVPYLPEEKIRFLAERSINAIDLCGNGVIRIPPSVYISKIGNDNKYPTSRPLKNPFSGKSAFVPRTLLTKRSFHSITSIQEEVFALGGDLSLGTVSKALSTLEEMFLISKKDKGVQLLQPDLLLQKLSQHNQTKPAKIIKGKVNETNLDKIAQKIFQLSKEQDVRSALLWLGMINPYAAIARPESIVAYTNSTSLVEALELDTHSKFPNVELRISKDPMVFFDRRTWLDGFMMLSPVQTFLELMRGGKREKEIAEQVKTYILDQLKEGEK